MESKARGTDTLIVHTHASPGGAGSVNAHWVETPEGIVVVDALREISQARSALARIEETGKPILAIFLTHGHADHVGGVGVFAGAAGPDAPVYASEETRKVVEEDPQGFRKLSRQMLGPDFPQDDALPNHRAIEHGQVVSAGGVDLEVHELGPGEAPSMTALRVAGTDILFPGDLVANRFTPLLLEGRSGAWVGQLERALGTFPGVRTAYPGHGRPASWEVLIREQLDYLRTLRGLVADAAEGRPEVTGKAKAAVVGEVERRYPGHPPVIPAVVQAVAGLPDLAELNVEAVARELAGSRP